MLLLLLVSSSPSSAIWQAPLLRLSCSLFRLRSSLPERLSALLSRLWVRVVDVAADSASCAIGYTGAIAIKIR